MERELARTRTRETMRRKAQEGHVAGGTVFGYRNVRDNSHVSRVVNEQEAAAVRRIFELCANGLGYLKIRQVLNAEGAPAPTPRRDRPRGWTASSIREVLHRNLYRGRVVYGKTRWQDREGTKIMMELPAAEAAVRELFAEHVLRPDVVAAVIEEAVRRLRPSAEAQEARRAELRQEIAQLDGQIGRLADAIANGGPMESLVGGMKDRDLRRARARQELANLDELDRMSEVDLVVLRRDLEELLSDWRAWIGGHNRQARQILQKLVAGRLTFTPVEDAGAWFYEFEGIGVLEPVLAGVCQAG